MLRKIKTIAPILSALLLILTFPRFNLEFLAWIALVPLFFALEERSKKARFAIGYLFGIVFFSGILYWLVNVSVPGAITLVLILAFYPALFSLLYRPVHATAFADRVGLLAAKTASRPTRSAKAVFYSLYLVIYVPALWVVTEYLRAHFFTGFPWALLGYSQSFNIPVIQIADITGAYGISFLIVIVNVALYLILKRAPKRFYSLCFIFFLLALALAYGQKRIRQIFPAQSLKVALIQANIPQEVKWDPEYRESILDKYALLTREAFKEKPHLLVWPETSLPGYLEEEKDLKKLVTDLAKSGNTALLLGTITDGETKIFNSATLISNKGKILKSYDKVHLVPFGEFIPFERAVSWMRGVIDKPIGDFGRGTEYTVFELTLQNSIVEPERIQSMVEFHNFSVLICFEDIFPGLARKFVKRGARFLINITNDAWFGKTAAPYQHLQGSIFRAVENRVPVLRAANTGVSCIIDGKGKVVKYVGEKGRETFVEGYAAGVIRPLFVKTFYTRFGDVFSWACILFVLSGFFASRKKNLLWLLLFIILSISLTACDGKEEIYYRGKLKISLPFGKKYDYNNILVTKVIDGDTVELEDTERVRLVGIDTPEAWYSSKLERDARRTKKDKRAIIEMGKRATQFTKSLADKKKVRLEFDIEKRDRYGRLLAYIYLPDGRMLNSELLKAGYAQVYTFPPNVKYVDMFLRLQREAKESGKGLWKE